MNMKRSSALLSKDIVTLLDADDRAVREHRAAGLPPNGTGDMEAFCRVIACILTRVARGIDPRADVPHDEPHGDTGGHLT